MFNVIVVLRGVSYYFCFITDERGEVMIAESKEEGEQSFEVKEQ